MALFVLIILGISLGWFSSILARTESARAILSQMGVGIAAALVAGVILNGGTILGALSLWGLGAGVTAALAALVMYHATVTRSQQANQPAE
ncbi:MAG: hypothetical protein AAFP79_01025 [Pseudomonadota bacterium]